ncbi:MAG: ACT domain-containing protein [Candidatus Omnitrophica bacterium]|nr:ACT domain-containing protein [Candidatus Omnitrophota bacterium]
MAQAKLAKELVVSADNKVGMLAEVSGIIADAGVNITAISAYAMAEKAIFRIVTSDNNKAENVLIQKGFNVEESEVVAVNLPDEVGQAKEIANKIKQAGINLDYIYGSTCGCADTQALMVIGSKENAKIVSAING